MRYILALIALSAVALSTILTLVFMVQIGSPTGLTAVFIGVGLVMEAAKTILPVLVTRAHTDNRSTQCLALGVLTALLMTVSFSASIVSVEAGAEGTRKLSSEYKDMTHQIQVLKDQSSDIRNRIDALPANYTTKRNDLDSKAVIIEDKTQALVLQRTQMKPNSIIVQYGSAIAVITATIIELITFLFVPLLFANKLVPKVEQVNTPNQQVPKMELEGCTEPTIKPVLTGSTASTGQDTVQGMKYSTIELAIREAVISKRIKPSCTGVRGMFSGIGNNRISALLHELGDEGVLIRNGRGWMFP